jgi:IS30 family transposase
MAGFFDDLNLISELELARQLDRHPATLERWRKRGTGPAPTMIGKTPMYRVATVSAWLLAQERQRLPHKAGRHTQLPAEKERRR